jgi:hypothetical protein
MAMSWCVGVGTSLFRSQISSEVAPVYAGRWRS